MVLWQGQPSSACLAFGAPTRMHRIGFGGDPLPCWQNDEVFVEVDSIQQTHEIGAIYLGDQPAPKERHVMGGGCGAF